MPPFSSKLSPNSIDLGYHTMVTYNESESGGFLEDSAGSPFTSLQLNPASMRAEFKCGDKKSSNAPSIDDLPDEVVVRVLSHLSTNDLCICARVSRKFYFLAWDPRLWNNISLSGGDSLDADAALDTLLRLVSREDEVCSTVTRVSLTGCSKLTDGGLKVVAQRCPRVRRLEIRGCRRVTNKGLADLVSRCGTLTYLDLMGEFSTERGRYDMILRSTVDAA